MIKDLIAHIRYFYHEQFVVFIVVAALFLMSSVWFIKATPCERVLTKWSAQQFLRMGFNVLDGDRDGDACESYYPN